jgi:hypothetical protein
MAENNERKKEGRSNKDDHNQGRKDRGDRSRDQQKPQGKGKQLLNSDGAVPMLKYGLSNSYDVFKKKLTVTCMGKYKNLGRLINDEKYYVPPEIYPMDCNLAQDMMSRKEG